MKLKNILRGYRIRMMLEGLLKSALYGIGTGAAAVLITSVIYHIQIKPTEQKLFFLIFAAVFLVTVSAVYFLKYYPNLKRTAARIDQDTGLEERTGTMVERWGKDGTMIAMQRKDALDQLEKITPRSLKFCLKKRKLIPAAAVVILAVIMLMIPYNILAKDADQTSDSGQSEMISALLEELREEARKYDDASDLQSEVDAILNDLEAALTGELSELEQAGEFSDAIGAIGDLLDQVLTRNRIGEALQRIKLTQLLGEAVSAGDTQKVSSAMKELSEKLLRDNSLIGTLAGNIRDALEDSGVDSADSLYCALENFANALEQDTEGEEASLKQDFDTAEAAIIAALEKQAEEEAYLKSMEEKLSDARDELLGIDDEEPDDQESKAADDENPGGEEPQGEKPSDASQEGGQPRDEEQQGEMPEGEMPQGGTPQGGEEIGNNMTESLYDPISGNVEYGDVFYSYYNDYLDAVASGDISEDLQEIIGNYFESLDQ